MRLGLRYRDRLPLRIALYTFVNFLLDLRLCLKRRRQVARLGLHFRIRIRRRLYLPILCLSSLLSPLRLFDVFVWIFHLVKYPAHFVTRSIRIPACIRTPTRVTHAAVAPRLRLRLRIRTASRRAPASEPKICLLVSLNLDLTLKLTTSFLFAQVQWMITVVRVPLALGKCASAYAARHIQQTLLLFTRLLRLRLLRLRPRRR